MTQTFQQTLAAVLADPLAAARRAVKPVGFVGSDLPPELALATGRVFCHLPWQAGRPTPLADQWLESSFPGWARSMLEDWADGVFDCFDAVVFTRGDDAAQRLYYYICELQRIGKLGGPRALVLDAATIPRESSVRHCRLALQRLLDELELDASFLAQGIAAANLRREWYRQLLQQGLPGAVMENLARATLFQDVYPACAALPLPAASGGRPLLLAGSAPPDDRLHHTVAAAGWNVGCELHARHLLRYGPPLVANGEEPLLQLARRLNAQPWGARSFADRAQLLQQQLGSAAPEAAVLWLTEEDESIAWDLARLRQVLAERGIPTLVLTRRRWTLDDGVLAEIEAFVEEL